MLCNFEAILSLCNTFRTAGADFIHLQHIFSLVSIAIWPVKQILSIAMVFWLHLKLSNKQMGLYSSRDLLFSAFRNQVSVLLSFSVTHRLVQTAFKVFLMLNRLHFKKMYGHLSYYLNPGEAVFDWFH